MFEVKSKAVSFTVTTTQTILAQDIQTIIWDTPNKIEAIQRIRNLFTPIKLKDAKEIHEYVVNENA